MKLRNHILRFLSSSILLVVSAVAVSAQNTMPDPQDDNCWTSLSALHSCVAAQYNRALEQAERCTSYPEYQCMPQQNAPNPELTKRSAKHDANAVSASPRDDREQLTVTGGSN